MSRKVPDAWDDEWTSAADTPAPPPESSEPKKVTGKVSKAQRRAQQAELNKQLWAEAEGPQETNYFLESRNIVPLRSEFKPPPVLLSRKGPTIKTSKPPTEGLNGLSIQGQESSSEDEDAGKKTLTLAERQAQAAKDREEKQRKYEERRQELFGPPGTGTANTKTKAASGNSSPGSLTPPSSRSATPNRGRGNGRGGRGRGGGHAQPQSQSRPSGQRELFDPTYTAKPESTYVQRRENGTPKPTSNDIVPQRAPKGPDGSGRGGFGFAARGGREGSATAPVASALEET